MSLEERLGLDAPFIVDEVKEVIWSGVGDKSPGPDGFNLGFFKSYREILKDDVLRFVNEIYWNVKVPKDATTSFLALMPKKDNPQTLNEFRNIYMIVSLYIIIANILANRLKEVMNGLISNS